MKSSPKTSNELLSMQDLEKVLRILKKNWVFLVILPVLFSFSGYFYAYRLPKIHGAKSKVLVEDEQTYDYQKELRQEVGYYGKYEKIQNQMRVIQSRDLIQEAISRLDIGISYHVVGRVKTQEFFKGMPYEVEMEPHKGRLYGKKIYLDILNGSKYRINYNYKDRNRSHTLSFGDTVNTPHFKIHVRAKPKMHSKKLEKYKKSSYYFVRHRKSSLVSQYSARLKVKNLEYTSIFQLRVHDPVPRRAVTFLDTLSRVYIEHTLEQRRRVNQNTLHYIERQLDKVTGILNEIEDTLENYKARHGILDIAKEKREYFEKLVSFDGKKRQMELRMESYNSLLKYVRNLDTKKEKLLPSSFYVAAGDEFLKKTISELYNLQKQRNQSLYQNKIKSPKIQEVEKEISEVKNTLISYIKNSKSAVKDRIKELEKQIAQYEGIISNIPGMQRGLLKIKRRRNVNEQLYKYLLEKRANTIIAQAGIVPETKVIESARSAGVVRPKEEKYVLMAGGGGLVLALLITFLRTLFFYRISSISELRELTHLPVLGQLFRHKTASKRNQLLFMETGRGIHAESLRNIRANLQFFLPEGQSSIIQINSVGPSEGKTFVSANLAQTLSKADKKVLLLELDLHKPRLHRPFDLSHEGAGVSSYLAGHESIEELINPSGEENLDLALCGEIPPNASELLLKKELKSLLDYGHSHYDFVLIDTPPVGIISDALILMPQADLNLFLLNAKSSRRQELRFIEDLVEKHELPSTALVLNGVRRNSLGYYYNRYSYLYGYRYGHGYYGADQKK